MSMPARSMQVWTAYILIVGSGLLIVPNVMLGLFGIAETDEVWIRVVGMLAVALAVLYWSMTVRDDRNGFRATVYERWFTAAALATLAFTVGPWQLVLFAILDFIGATWTHLALSSVRRSASTGPAAG